MAKQLDLKDNSIHNLQGGYWNQRMIKPLDIKKLDYNKLRTLSEDLNSKLQDKFFREKYIHLFGENYEHNTDDDLLKVHGWNENNYLIETGNLVGSVSTKDFKINISSRFGDDFLKYVLCYTEGTLEIPDEGTIGKDGLYEWVMIFLWKTALQRASRLGIPKQYIPKQEKLYSVKGNVDLLNYTIYRGMDGKILSNYYQYDFNNPVTQLIAYTFSKIWKKAFIQDCARLRNTFECCVDGKKTSLSTCLNTRPIANPYYSDYNKVISLSKSILRRKYGDITDTSDISSAFLFDMSMLFEFFVRKVISKKRKLFVKNDNSMTISRGLGKNNDRNLYPDIIIDKGEGKIEVYDVKYKHFNFQKGVNREDLFQMHTYVSYLSNDYTVLKCGIIYPNSGGTVKSIENNIIRHPKNQDGIPFNICFFNIPKAESIEDKKENNKEDNSLEKFKDFKDRMKQSNEDFLTLF